MKSANLIASVSAIALILAAQNAYAANSLSITQVGTSDISNITQFGDVNSSVIQQTGSNNTVTSTPTAAGYRNVYNVLQTGDGNSSTLVNTGSDNQAYVSAGVGSAAGTASFNSYNNIQQNGQFEIALIQQYGYLNAASAIESGEHNGITISQTQTANATGNDTTAVITGADNNIVSQQVGANAAAIGITGNSDKGSVYQTNNGVWANRNTATIAENGFLEDAYIEQNGLNNTATINQTGGNSSAFIYQTGGNNNTATITQTGFTPHNANVTQHGNNSTINITQHD